MSVLFLPPSAGAASVPDATETVSGKIRIATSAEATTGTNDLTAMTPAKVKSVVDAAVVGGVTYQGTFDTSSPVDLSNALKGDLYVISVAGTYQGIVWAVGDHLLINEDMGGTISPSKLDKVDNTDAVTSVAGKTGAVTLVPADVTGLATVASTGAYSDLSGTPTLGTAAAEDVGTSAGNVVQLDGSARLPAVDGSQLLNLPSGATFHYTAISTAGPTLAQIADSRRQHYGITLYSPGNPITVPVATSAAIGGVISFYNSTTNQAVINCPGARLLSGSFVTSFTVEPDESRSFVWVGVGAFEELTATRVDRLNDVSISSPSGGEALVYNGTLSVFENATISAGGATTLGALTDVDVTGVANTNVIKYNSTSGDWEDGAVAYSEVTGTPTLGTAAAEDVGTSAGNVVQLDGSARLPAVDGSQLTNLPSGSTLPTVTTQTGSYTIPSRTAGQLNLVVLVNNGASAVTIDLPSIASGDVGFMIDIKVLGTGTVTVDAGSNYIDDGATTSILITTQYDSRTLLAGTTTDWYII
ncbi:MAG: hypothetical protein ACPF8W_01030 [Luminiphilus sp.]